MTRLSSYRAFLLLGAIGAFVVFGTLGSVLAQEQDDGDGNQLCPKEGSFYVYDASKPYGAKVGDKVNLYGKRCYAEEAKDLAAEGRCVGPSKCEAKLCDGKPCQLPKQPISTSDVQKALQNNTVQLNPTGQEPQSGNAPSTDIWTQGSAPIQNLDGSTLFGSDSTKPAPSTIAPSGQNVLEQLEVAARGSDEPGIFQKAADTVKSWWQPYVSSEGAYQLTGEQSITPAEVRDLETAAHSASTFGQAPETISDSDPQPSWWENLRDSVCNFGPYCDALDDAKYRRSGYTITAYGPPTFGWNAMQGGQTTSRPGVDGTHKVRTLEDVRRWYDSGGSDGSPYVTLATHPSNNGKFFDLGTVKYKSEIDGKWVELPNVVGYSHDTGSAFMDTTTGSNNCARWGTCGEVRTKIDIAEGKYSTNSHAMYEITQNMPVVEHVQPISRAEAGIRMADAAGAYAAGKPFEPTPSVGTFDPNPTGADLTPYYARQPNPFLDNTSEESVVAQYSGWPSRTVDGYPSGLSGGFVNDFSSTGGFAATDGAPAFESAYEVAQSDYNRAYEASIAADRAYSEAQSAGAPQSEIIALRDERNDAQRRLEAAGANLSPYQTAQTPAVPRSIPSALEVPYTGADGPAVSESAAYDMARDAADAQRAAYNAQIPQIEPAQQDFGPTESALRQAGISLGGEWAGEDGGNPLPSVARDPLGDVVDDIRVPVGSVKADPLYGVDTSGAQTDYIAGQPGGEVTVTELPAPVWDPLRDITDDPTYPIAQVDAKPLRDPTTTFVDDRSDVDGNPLPSRGPVSEDLRRAIIADAQNPDIPDFKWEPINPVTIPQNPALDLGGADTDDNPLPRVVAPVGEDQRQAIIDLARASQPEIPEYAPDLITSAGTVQPQAPEHIYGADGPAVNADVAKEIQQDAARERIAQQGAEQARGTFSAVTDRVSNWWTDTKSFFGFSESESTPDYSGITADEAQRSASDDAARQLLAEGGAPRVGAPESILSGAVGEVPEPDFVSPEQIERNLDDAARDLQNKDVIGTPITDEEAARIRGDMARIGAPRAPESNPVIPTVAEQPAAPEDAAPATQAPQSGSTESAVLAAMEREREAARAAEEKARARYEAEKSNAELIELTGGRPCVDTGFIGCPLDAAARDLQKQQTRLTEVESRIAACAAGQCPADVAKAIETYQSGGGTASNWLKGAEDRFAADKDARLALLKEGTLLSPVHGAYWLSDTVGEYTVKGVRAIGEAIPGGEYVGFSGAKEEAIGDALNPGRRREETITAIRDAAMVWAPVAGDAAVSSKGIHAIGGWTASVDDFARGSVDDVGRAAAGAVDNAPPRAPVAQSVDDVTGPVIDSSSWTGRYPAAVADDVGGAIDDVGRIGAGAADNVQPTTAADPRYVQQLARDLGVPEEAAAAAPRPVSIAGQTGTFDDASRAAANSIDDATRSGAAAEKPRIRVVAESRPIETPSGAVGGQIDDASRIGGGTADDLSRTQEPRLTPAERPSTGGGSARQAEPPLTPAEPAPATPGPAVGATAEAAGGAAGTSRLAGLAWRHPYITGGALILGGWGIFASNQAEQSTLGEAGFKTAASNAPAPKFQPLAQWPTVQPQGPTQPVTRPGSGATAPSGPGVTVTPSTRVPVAVGTPTGGGSVPSGGTFGGRTQGGGLFGGSSGGGWGAQIGQYLSKLFGLGASQQQPSGTGTAGTGGGTGTGSTGGTPGSPLTPSGSGGTPAPAPTKPTPLVALIANPAEVEAGTGATLAWASVGVQECTLFGPGNSRIGSGNPDGRATTTPLATTTVFTVRCTGDGGSAAATTTVRVR